MNVLKKAILNSSVTSLLNQVINLISAIIVARMLSPEELGKYAVLTALVMVFAEFKLLGAGIYLVKEKELNTSSVSKAFGLTILMSSILGFVIIVLAYPISYFYELENVIYVMLLFSITFFLSPFVSIPSALLTREMNFAALRNISISKNLIVLLSSVFFIYLGFSYYSLAFAYVLGFFSQLVILKFSFRSDIFPVRPSLKNLGAVASIGIFTSLAGFFRKFTSVVPDLIIGKQGSFNDVGVFSRGYGFSIFLSQSIRTAIGPISLPYLSMRNREGESLHKDYIRGSYLYNGFVMPVLTVGALASLPSIRLLFGSQWDLAAPVASSLMVWAGIRALNFQFSSLLVILDKAKIIPIQELIHLLLVSLFIYIFYDISLAAAANAMIVAAILELIFISVILRRFIELDFIKFFIPQIKNIAISAISSLPTLLIYFSIGFEENNSLLVVILIAFITPLFWFFSIRLLNHPLRNHLNFKF